MKQKSPISRFAAVLLIVGLLFLLLWPSFVQAVPLTVRQELLSAWQLAGEVGQYGYRSTVIQTTYPTAKLENVGRNPRTKRMVVEGEIDTPRDFMAMQLRNANPGTTQLIDLKVEDGLAYGRMDTTADWQRLDDADQLFSPGSNPLGFLVAAEDVEEIAATSHETRDTQRETGDIEPVNSLLDASRITFHASRAYAFNLNGLSYASYMRGQMEEQLRRNGELPAGLRLGMVRDYIDMDGSGEIWLNDDGLPVRQTMHVKFPPKRGALSWYEVEIITEYRDWGTLPGSKLAQLWHDPSTVISNPATLAALLPTATPEQAQNVGLTLALLMVMGGATAFLIAHRRSPRLYASLASAVMIAMIIGPLFQTQQASAFYDRQQEKQIAQQEEQAKQQELETIQADLRNADFDPQKNPLENTEVGIRSTEYKSKNHATRNTQHAARSTQHAALQTDCDTTTNDDCDGDGLSNEAELYKLGTSPFDIDSDNDYISDKTEVEGFELNGTHWYLDPLNPDSNGDGLVDTYECAALTDITADGTWEENFTVTSCLNSDNDDTPDVFDFDNDGDGVPDTVDDSPFIYFGDPESGLDDQQFNFNLSFHDQEKPVFADFVVRPIDPGHLWQTNNVFNWPDNDTDGQIMRVHNTTLADFDDYSSYSKADNGDMLLVPMLEFEISYDATNPSAGLPISGTTSVDSITDYSSTNWIDTDALDELSISVSSVDDQTLLIYVPLSVVEDDTGDSLVGWAGRMLYRPTTGVSDLGNDQAIRLIWLVQMIVDTCDTSTLTESDDIDEYCDDEDNWTSEVTVVQTYYDDFFVTALNITEDHGSDLAIVAQPSTVGGSDYDDYLWHLADTLQQTLIGVESKPDGNRFSVTDIADYLDDWNISGLDVTELTLDDQLALVDVAVDDTSAILNRVFADAAVDEMAMLLFAGEETARTVDLGSSDDQEINANTLHLDLSASTLNTTAILRWAPYLYQGASTWDSTEPEDYLDQLELDLTSVLTDDELDTLVGGEPISDYDAARTGAITMAQSFFYAIYTGVSAEVAIDGDEPISGALADYSRDGEVMTTILDEMIAKIQDYYGELSIISALTESTDAITDAANALSATFAESASILLESLGTATDGDATTALTLALEELSDYYKTVEVDTTKFTDFTSISALAWASSASTQSGGFIFGKFLWQFHAGFYNIIWGTAQAKKYTTIISAVGTLLDSPGGSYKETLKSLASAGKIRDTMRTWAVVTFVLTTAFYLAVFFLGHYNNQLERSAALADTIAKIIVAALMMVLTAIPLFGWVIAGVIALIDALAMLICHVLDVEEGSVIDQWVCSGITGAITQAIITIIFDQYIVVDLDDDDRLEITFVTPTLVQNNDVEGYMVGNEITYSATVTNTISRAPVEGTNWGTYMASKWFKTHDLEEMLTKSTFVYTLQQSQTDHHSGLSANGTTWDDENSATFDVALTQKFTKAGINEAMKLYFSESFYLPALECWGFVVQGCHREDYKDTFHNYLGDSFIFDVFPQTFDEFIALTKTSSGAYRQSWASEFPDQSDADADGLRSSADPNDGTWDTDGDGLSDFWEEENGYDAEDADPDGDGLPDYWEAFYDTDPYQQDSDGDGLWDGAEFFHSQSMHPYADDNSTWTGGWTIVYDYDANDDRLETLVSADPNDYDSDDDTIIDNLEYIYGYNPNVASTLNVLSLDAGVDTDLVAIGDTINYTATVGNELDNRVADGLIEVEFPVDTLQTTKVIGSLYPQMETAVSGSITAPAVAASTTSSVTIRAGAVIDTSALDQVLVLNFNEETGSTTFYDATSNRLDFTCTSSCPTANGDTITMAGAQSLTVLHDDKLNLDAFSIVTWIKPTVANKIIYNDDNDLWLKLNNNKQIEVILDGSTTQLTGAETLPLDEWHHVVVTIDNLNGEVQIFVNGQLDKSFTGQPAIGWTNNTVKLGTNYSGEIDYFSIYEYALTETEILEAFFNGFSFAAGFDEASCSYRNTITNDDFACGSTSESMKICANYDCSLKMTEEWDATPNKDAGIVGDAIELSRFSGDTRLYLDYDQTFSLADDDNAFTISTWLKPNATGGSYTLKSRLLTMPHDSGDKLKLWFTGFGGTLNVEMDGCSTKSISKVYSNMAWFQLTLTYDGSNTLKVYKNGELLATQSCSSSADFTTVDGVRLGFINLSTNTSDNSSQNSFFGTVDEVRFRHGALSADEVVSLYEDTHVQLKFDEAPGQTTFAAESFSTVTASCAGSSCPDSGLAGVDNQSLYFDGDDDYLSLSATADAMGFVENNFTVMAWVKGDDFSGFRAVLGTDTAATGEGLQLGTRYDGNPHFGFFNGDLVGTTLLEPDRWYHLAWRYTYEGDDSESFIGKQAIFVNGELDVEEYQETLFIGTDTVHVGRSNSGRYFEGKIDDLIIVQDALDETEIQAYMNQSALLNLHLDADLNTTTFTDDSPYGNDATCASTGSATASATEFAEVCPEAGDKGQLREAIVLDGDDSLTVPAATELSLEDFSIALWVKPTQAKDADQWLVRKGTSSGYQRNYGLALVTDSDDELHLDFTVQSSCLDSDSSWKFVESADALIENQWNHIVAVHDSSANTMQLYINGTLDVEKTPGYTGTCTADQAITIGEDFEGNLDEIAIYGYALDDDEILEIYDYQVSWYDLKYQQLLTVDADDPDLAVNLNNDYLPLADSWLSISAVDATSAVESVAVTLTDPNNSVTNGSAELDNQAWLYWFAPTVEGAYTLEVTATDSVGNQTTTTKTIYVDNAPPVATLDSALTTGVHQPQPSATDGVDEVTLFGALDDSGGIVDSGLVTNSVVVELLDWQGISVDGTTYADYLPPSQGGRIGALTICSRHHPMVTMTYGSAPKTALAT